MWQWTFSFPARAARAEDHHDVAERKEPNLDARRFRHQIERDLGQHAFLRRQLGAYLFGELHKVARECTSAALLVIRRDDRRRCRKVRWRPIQFTHARAE
jgi:hypothetical protein